MSLCCDLVFHLYPPWLLYRHRNNRMIAPVPVKPSGSIWVNEPNFFPEKEPTITTTKQSKSETGVYILSKELRNVSPLHAAPHSCCLFNFTWDHALRRWDMSVSTDNVEQLSNLFNSHKKKHKATHVSLVICYMFWGYKNMFIYIYM